MRAKILVEVDTDQVPGWGYDPQDYVNHIQHHLNKTIGHYNPQVTLLEENKKEDPFETHERLKKENRSVHPGHDERLEAANQANRSVYPGAERN